MIFILSPLVATSPESVLSVAELEGHAQLALSEVERMPQILRGVLARIFWVARASRVLAKASSPSRTSPKRLFRRDAETSTRDALRYPEETVLGMTAREDWLDLRSGLRLFSFPLGEGKTIR